MIGLIALLVVSVSGCIDISQNNNSNGEDNGNHSNGPNNSNVQNSDLISDKTVGSLQLSEFEIHRTNSHAPFVTKVVSYSKMNKVVMIKLEVEPTTEFKRILEQYREFDPDVYYKISIVSAFPEVLIKKDSISDGLVQDVAYKVRSNGWGSGYAFIVENDNYPKYEITLFVGRTDSNIIYNKFQYYDFVKVNYMLHINTNNVKKDVLVGTDIVAGVYK